MRRAHDIAMDLARTNTEINRVWCVPNEDFRRFRGRTPVDGLILREVREPSGASPYWLVEIAIDGCNGIDSRHIDVRAVCSPRINKRGILEQSDCSQ